VLSGGAFAARASSEEHGNQNKYIPESAKNSYGNEIKDLDGTNSSESNSTNSSESNKTNSSESGNTNSSGADNTNSSGSNNTNSSGSNNTSNSDSNPEMIQSKLSVKDENKISEYKQDRDKLKDELQLQKKEYQQAKKDFLKTRDQIRAGKLNPQSNEALNATKLYLNSSINYMVAHLSNVKSNLDYSNGNGTEGTIVVIDEKIKLLETEKVKVANASNQKELADDVKSVRGIWEDAQEISLASTGQIVSGKIGEYLEKSELLSEKLDERIKGLNETGADTSDLEIKLASYKSYIKSAQEKKKDSDSIFNDKNTTTENLEKANNYLLQSLSDINKANKLLRDIFEGLKNTKPGKMNETVKVNGTEK
jgi:hypothetical protein